MMNYENAKILAQTWVDLSCSEKAKIIDEETIFKPYGWIFFYQSESYLETEDFREMLVGNAPILIDRTDGEVKVFGTAHSIEEYLEEYEKTIPAARLYMKPEFPTNNS